MSGRMLWAKVDSVVADLPLLRSLAFHGGCAALADHRIRSLQWSAELRINRYQASALIWLGHTARCGGREAS